MRRALQFRFLLLVLFAMAAPAGAAEVTPGIEIDASLQSRQNYLDRGALDMIDQFHFDREETFTFLDIRPSLAADLTGELSAFAQVDIQWEHHFETDGEEDDSAELVAAYLSLTRGRTNLDAGFLPVVFGKGRLLTDDAPGLDLTVREGDGSVEVTAARILDSSPVIGLTLGYRPGFLEQISLMGIWFQDRDDLLARSTPQLVQLLLDPESEGDLYWLGATADLFVGKALFSLVGAYQFGRVELFNANRRVAFDVRAYYGEVSLETNLSPSFSMGAFGVLASGDDTPLSGDLNAFVAVQPYNPRAAIFFDPDFLDHPDEDHATFGGGPAAGVIAPGLTMSYAPGEAWRFDLTGTMLYAHEPRDDRNRWYGWELDLDLHYRLSDHYSLYGHAATFRHGDYFEALLEETPDPAFRFEAGVHASF